MSLLNFLRSAPYLPEIQDQDEMRAQYKYWRKRTFCSLYIGYVFFYFTRKSFTFAMPSLIEDLGIKMSELGMISTIFAVTYGFSKFVSGALADRSNPRYFMAIGLMLTGVINLCFGWSSSVAVFMPLWALNGFFQGWGWPPCAKLLTHWFSHGERGRWWSVFNTSLSVGGALIPFVVGICVQCWGWRSALFVPGVSCIIMGFFLMNRLRDIPQTLGLPSVEVFKNDASSPKVKEKNDLPFKELLFSYVLKNPYLWILSFSYFCLYIVRQSMNDYSALFLIKTKGYAIMTANVGLTCFEAGGLCGALLAGWLSDVCFGGRRFPVIIFYGLGVIAAILSFYLMPAGWVVANYLALFLTGFCVFGPQMLLGMAAAEMVDKKAAATANGFAGWCSYLGAAVAGYPIAKLTETYGWGGFTCTLVTCGVLIVLPLIPLWKIKTYSKPIPAQAN